MTLCNDDEYDAWLAHRARCKAAAARRQLVVLTPERLKQAVDLATARNKKEPCMGPMTYGGRLSGNQAHLVGILGEQAVAQHYGLLVDASVYDRHGDQGVDLVIPCLGVSGVKTTTYLDDPLLRVELEHATADYFILACVPDVADKPHEVYLCGFTTREKLLTEGRRVRFVPGGPLNWVMSEPDLDALPPRKNEEGVQPGGAGGAVSPSSSSCCPAVASPGCRQTPEGGGRVRPGRPGSTVHGTFPTP